MSLLIRAECCTSHLILHSHSYNNVKAISISNLEFRSNADVNIGGLFFSYVNASLAAMAAFDNEAVLPPAGRSSEEAIPPGRHQIRRILTFVISDYGPARPPQTEQRLRA